jgi:hypothetical protein
MFSIYLSNVTILVTASVERFSNGRASKVFPVSSTVSILAFLIVGKELHLAITEHSILFTATIQTQQLATPV